MADVFIRSYHDYSVNFQLAGGAVVIPSKHSKPSTIKITDAQYLALAGDDTPEHPGVDEFKALLAVPKSGYRVVDSMPRDQVDLIERISAANDAVEAAKKEVEDHKAAAEKAKSDYEVLKAKVDADGGDIANEVLDKIKEEKELALAEIDEWKVKFKELEAKLASSSVEIVKTVVEE